jgi:hypothetical protein
LASDIPPFRSGINQTVNGNRPAFDLLLFSAGPKSVVRHHKDASIIIRSRKSGRVEQPGGKMVGIAACFPQGFPTLPSTT